MAKHKSASSVIQNVSFWILSVLLYSDNTNQHHTNKFITDTGTRWNKVRKKE